MLSTFNAITLHNDTQTNSETEGPVVVGGNLNAAQVDTRNRSVSASTFSGFGQVNAYGNANVQNANAPNATVGGGSSKAT